MPSFPAASAPSAYYQPSGQVARGAVLTGIGYGAAVVPAAWLYAWVTMRAPAPVNLVALLIFALWIAVVADLVALRARVRSRVWIARYACVLALCAWYCQWATWLALERHLGTGLLHGAVSLAAHPGALFAAAAGIARHNAWGLETMPMVAAWLVEGYVLLQIAPGLGLVRVAQPFCEASGTWAARVTVPRKFAPIDQPAAVARLLEQAPQQLPSVVSAWPAPAPRHATLTLFRCRGGDVYITISHTCTRVERGARAAARAGDVVVALRLPGMDPDALFGKLLARADAPPALREGADSSVAPQLASALALYRAARFADALARALPYARAPRFALRLAANRLCAQCCASQGKWRDACGHWSAVFDDEPAVRNALQLAGSLVMSGQLEHGHLWFERARTLNDATGELAPLAVLGNFVDALDLAGHPKMAMRSLDEIRECYCRQGVTDPAVLAANRLPLFHEFLETSAPVVLAARGRQAGLRWFAAMLGRLDEAGNVELGQWLDEQERSLAR